MKHLVLSLITFFIALSGLQAQSIKELKTQLHQNLEDYRRYTLAHDFENSMQYMPPKMFDLIPRDSLIATMRQAMDNEYMRIEMTGLDFKSKSKIKIKKAGEYHWALVPYDGSMRLNLKGDAGYRSILVKIFKEQFGKKNVLEENESGLLIMLKNKQLIAFKDPARQHWSLLEDKRKNNDAGTSMEKLIFETAIPEPVRKALNE